MPMRGKYLNHVDEVGDIIWFILPYNNQKYQS